MVKVPTKSIQTGLSEDSIGSLIAQMNNRGSVLKGWDSVLNISSEVVSRILESQYKSPKIYPDFLRSIPEQTITQEINETVTVLTKFEFNLSKPELSMTSNGSIVQLKMQIVSGWIQRGSKISGQDNLGAKENVTTGLLTAHVPIQVIDSKSDKKNVTLDLSQASAQISNLNVSVDLAGVNASLNRYFGSLEVCYPLLSLSCTNYTEKASLTPVGLAVNTLVSNSGKQILQIFIATIGKILTDRTVSVGEPIPEGQDFSFILNTRIAFSTFVVPAFNNNGKYKARLIPATNSYEAFKAKIIVGAFTGELLFEQNSRYRITEASDNVTLSLNEAMIQGTENGELEFSLQQKFSQNFQYYERFPPTQDCPEHYEWIDHSLEVGVTGSSTHLIRISAQDPPQVKTQEGKTTIAVSSDHSNLLPAFCSPSRIDQRLMNWTSELRAAAADQINLQMTELSFNEIATFVLRNISLAGGKTMHLTSAALPGDFVLFATCC